ncbi:MAG: preprotein translocase subunit YajC [Candidatus Omnitrophota bacterium]|nr:preprotein translocase subunit YajC [Candidatus Omnitrophota bacterium]
MASAPNPLINLLPIILIFVIFYFLLIRPQKKQQDGHKKMVAALKRNDEVITAGGIHGTIVNVKEHTVTLKVDDNVKVEVQKSSIATMKRKAAE